MGTFTRYAGAAWAHSSSGRRSPSCLTEQSHSFVERLGNLTHLSPRLAVILAVGIVAALAVALHAPIPQPAAYHAFADQRRILGVPNFWNVVSNLPLLLVGWAGVRELAGHSPRGALASLRAAYFCFFFGGILVALGSAYYHLEPSNDTLTWDRLPMTLVFMAFFSIIIGEHLSPSLGRRLLVPLVLLGLASVVYWHLSERANDGDLRPYILVQYLPAALVPAVLLLFPSRLSRVGLMWSVLGAYALAKLFEVTDRLVFSLGQIVSGHTLKHLVAALGMYIFLVALKVRRDMHAEESAVIARANDL